VDVRAFLPIGRLAVTPQVQDCTTIPREVVTKTGNNLLPDMPKLPGTTWRAANMGIGDLVWIEELQKQKLLIAERIKNIDQPKTSYDQGLITALAFLRNPWKLWTPGDHEHWV